jgi:hypothetical protein
LESLNVLIITDRERYEYRLAEKKNRNPKLGYTECVEQVIIDELNDEGLNDSNPAFELVKELKQMLLYLEKITNPYKVDNNYSQLDKNDKNGIKIIITLALFQTWARVKFKKNVNYDILYNKI